MDIPEGVIQMEFYDNTELSDESTEVANLINELRELKLTSFALEIAIKILKSFQIEELGDRVFTPLDINTILSNFNKN